jgi:RNA polymerase sigma-70 factor (ECF subfamily)
MFAERFNTQLASPETTTFGYDRVGNLDWTDLPGTMAIDYVYDDQHCLIDEIYFADTDGDHFLDWNDSNSNDLYSAGEGEQPYHRFQTTRDIQGRRVAGVDTTYQQTFNTVDEFRWAYDEAGRLAKEDYIRRVSDSPTAWGYTDYHAYDLNSNRTRVDRAVFGTQGGGDLRTFTRRMTFDANDRLMNETIDYADGVDSTQDFTYGPNNSWTKLTRQVKNTGGSYEEVQYTYDAAGRSTSPWKSAQVSILIDSRCFLSVFLIVLACRGEGVLNRDSEDAAEWSVEASICSARAGSFSAVGKLLDFYRGFLLSVANGELSAELAQKVAPSDLVQETCFQAARGFLRFEGKTEGELKAWLRQILLNNVRDAERRFRRADKRDCSREVPIDTHGHGSEWLTQLATTDATPSNQVAQAEIKAILATEIRTLSQEQRAVVQLRSFEGLSFEEVGQAIGKSADAARKIWARTIDELADRMPRDESGER